MASTTFMRVEEVAEELGVSKSYAYKIVQKLNAVIEIVVHFLPNYLESGSTAFVQLGVFLAIPLLCCYNGKRGSGGRAAKWGFYIFYPAHLLVLWILNLALGV